MTDFNRSSTLSLRRPASPALSATPAQSRKSTDRAAAAPAVGAERTLDSTRLLHGRSLVSITHNGETYQLRATRLGKLILTK